MEKQKSIPGRGRTSSGSRMRGRSMALSQSSSWLDRVPVTAEGEVLDGDFEAQTRLTFENMQVVLEQPGATFGSVVKLTAYFTDIGNLRQYAMVRNEFIVDHSPASTAIEVGKLALPGMTIEVEAIAVL